MSDLDYDQVESPQTSPPRRKPGGLMSVLGLLVPVVAGGLTVFGVYFLFLEDWLKKAPPKKAAETKSESTESNLAEQDEPRVVPLPRSTPIAKPDRPETPSQLQPAKEPAPTKASIEDREKKAENALNLAKKMLQNKPSAAPSWFQKVVDQYPGTKAANEAETWLKQRSREP